MASFSKVLTYFSVIGLKLLAVSFNALFTCSLKENDSPCKSTMSPSIFIVNDNITCETSASLGIPIVKGSRICSGIAFTCATKATGALILSKR